MPTIIVHELGKPPRTATFDLPQILIGREEGCQVVLNNASVSRQHAVVQRLPDGRWACQALKDENPLVVDGEVTTSTCLLQEGSQLQIGRVFVIFSLEAQARRDYMVDQAQYDAVCQGCQWQGVLSAMARAPACPRCGGNAFLRSDDLAAETSRGPVLSGPTSYLQPDDLQRMHERINQAKNARIERLTPATGLPPSFALSESATCVFGKKGSSNMPIEGFLFGGPATIRWVRPQYVLQKGGFFPGLKVNGSPVKERGLKDGDQIVLGKNRFRFVVSA